MSDVRLVKSFAKFVGLTVSYHFVRMITGLKQNFKLLCKLFHRYKAVHTWYSNLFPHFVVHAEFSKRLP